MANIKPIHTDADYEEVLDRINELMDAEAVSPEADELDVLTTLVESYESEQVTMPPPNPIEAIRFRMDQAGLSPRDLIPYFGSRAKVHEVLSGKRAITMPMARALHEHLGIPAEVLLSIPRANPYESLTDIDPLRYPIKKMAKLGWFEEGRNLKDRAGELMAELIRKAGVREAVALYRKNDSQRVNAKTDFYALEAWCWRVMALANMNTVSCDYVQGTVTLKLLREIAHLSVSENGPLLARGYLAGIGVFLEVVPHLPKTYLDGAAMRLSDGRPVIGLTLRYDRIDNFWFSLLHELAHIGLHLDQDKGDFFADDFTLRGSGQNQGESRELEADQWVEEALIPSESWESSTVRESSTALGVVNLASQLGIHPAIVAGRIRYENKNYRLLSQFVGNGVVRRQFAYGRTI